MFKKLSALLLALLLAIACAAPALADESNTVQIEPVFLEIFDMTSTEWYEDYTSRTLLATSVLLDIILSDYDELEDMASSALLKGSVYVGKSSLSLYTFFYCETGTFFASFVPATGNFNVSILDSTFSITGAENAMSGMRTDGLLDSYYKIDSADILSMYEMVVDALNSDE